VTFPRLGGWHEIILVRIDIGIILVRTIGLDDPFVVPVFPADDFIEELYECVDDSVTVEAKEEVHVVVDAFGEEVVEGFDGVVWVLGSEFLGEFGGRNVSAACVSA
jgi:hypothetical protein